MQRTTHENMSNDPDKTGHRLKPEPEFVIKSFFDSAHMTKKAVLYETVFSRSKYQRLTEGQEQSVGLHGDLTALPFSTTAAIIV